jgi:hypothetical protein
MKKSLFRKHMCRTRHGMAVVCLALCCLTGILPMDAAEAADKVDLYALIVAVGKQKDTSQQALPIHDAKLLRDFLVERRNLFGEVRVAMLEDEQATRDKILQALTKELAQARKEDLVLVFLEGHGSASPATPGKYYFLPYDYDAKKGLESTICVSDKKLFENIKSDRVLFLTGSCLSGGFLPGLARGKPPIDYMNFFKEMRGRSGISASRADEVAWAGGKLGMNVFGFYLIKALRGAADTSNDGVITLKELYDYVHENVAKETQGAQHPQLFCATGAESTPIYSVPKFEKKMELDVKFLYDTEDNRARLLTENTVLKSGQHVAVFFKPAEDCYVHILWWDSSGQVGSLFPNPKLSAGTGLVKGGKAYWLPYKGQEGGKHWYVLDDKPGWETVYFVASRERNPKLEELIQKFQELASKEKVGTRGTQVSQDIEREINLMGFADHTVPVKAEKVSYASREKLVEELESKINVSGADAFFKLRFKHE